MRQSGGSKIFLTSFLVLFLELALIRFLPSQIAYLGYYSNFILLATFVGMGGGILIANKSFRLEWHFPWVLALLVFLSVVFKVSLKSGSRGEVFFHADLVGRVVPEVIGIPVLFFLVVGVFIFISQSLGRYLNELHPLKAYAWDILGSLSGIVAFTVGAFFEFNPLVWFSIVGLLFLYLHWERSSRWCTAFFVFILLILCIIPVVRDARWSPYQKVTIEPIVKSGKMDGYTLYVNNIAHQSFVKDINQMEQGFYRAPYVLFNKSDYQRALIIGAGTGNDVAMALKYNVEHIDAVEIDPQILRVGKQLHPNRPYQDPRVTTYTTDARAFLEKTKNKYDLIIYALPDSLTLVSSQGNIRLESFLFTQEALESAKNRLTENGVLVLYNFYRSPWLVAKISGLVETVFKQPSYISIRGAGNWWPVIITNGGKLKDLKTSLPATANFLRPFPVLPTDDWPFLYLLKPSFPVRYFFMLGIIGVIIYFILSYLSGHPLQKKLEWDYFFMGAAFLLLETKSVIQFSLLFGSTWIVNSLVFFAILSLVLLAIIFVAKVRRIHFRWWYLALFTMLFIQYLFPVKGFIHFDPVLRYLLASLLMLGPIFLANVIFSYTFKESKMNSLSFASNSLGAAVGAILEYFALLVGYRHLVFCVILFYMAVFFFQWKKKSSLMV